MFHAGPEPTTSLQLEHSNRQTRQDWINLSSSVLLSESELTADLQRAATRSLVLCFLQQYVTLHIVFNECCFVEKLQRSVDLRQISCQQL